MNTVLFSYYIEALSGTHKNLSRLSFYFNFFADFLKAC